MMILCVSCSFIPRRRPLQVNLRSKWNLLRNGSLGTLLQSEDPTWSDAAKYDAPSRIQDLFRRRQASFE